MKTVVDMTKGVYRRVYSGFLGGRRINSVTIGAEAWFWRLLMLADDFGNLAAEPNLLAAHAAGKRRVRTRVSEAWVEELIEAGLVRTYTVEGERYLSIVDFRATQPAGKNGRRIQRVPQPPSHTEVEPSAVQGDPRRSEAAQSSDSETESDTDTETESDGGVSVGIRACPSLAGVHIGTAASIVNEYPMHKRTAPRVAAAACLEAIQIIAERGTPKPVDWLRGRVRAFAASPAARQGRFTLQATAWFRDGHYDDPDEAWQQAGKEPDKQRTKPDLDAIANRNGAHS